MSDKLIKTYVALLICLVFIWSFGLSVGHSYARYENVASYNTILKFSKEPLSTDGYLRKNSDKKVTVLVGELSKKENKKVISFDITADEKEKNSFVWSLSTEHAQYVDVKVNIETIAVENGAEVVVPKNESRTVSMTVTVNDAAWVNNHSAMDVDINVFWGELCGTFRLSIPEIDVQTATDAGAQSGNSSAGDSGISLNSPENQQAPIEPEVNTPESGSQRTAIALSSIKTFAPEQFLPVKVSVSAETTHVVFGIGEEGYDVARNFPEGTCFSIDGGASFYMVYGSDTVKIDAEKIRNKTILFDLSNTAIKEAESVTVIAEDWEDGIMQGNSKITVLTNAEGFVGVFEHDGNDSAQLMGNGSENPGKTVPKGETCILDKNDSLEFTFPMEWQEADLVCSAEILSVGENGSTVYRKTEDIKRIYKKDENTHSIVLDTRDGASKAGTYRVYTIWKYNDVAFYRTETIFFVNYSEVSETTLKGKEVLGR